MIKFTNMKVLSTFEKKVVDETFKILEVESGFTREMITSKSRKTEVVSARYVAMYVVKKMTKLSLASIGEVFDRDHSSIIHALDNVQVWFESPKRYIPEMIMIQKVTTTVAGELDHDTQGMSQMTFA